MSQVRLVLSLARYDLLERIRRPGFLFALLITLYLGYLYLPEPSSNYLVVSIGHTRGIYNSAWVGAAASLLSSAFLSLIGFYLVKNAVERDRKTGVGQILAATPISRFQYLLSKALSNTIVLSMLLTATVVAMAAMQILRGEETRLDVINLISPSLFMALPFLSLIAATAVFFEVVPQLRGALGNVIFYFAWVAIIIISFTPAIKKGSLLESSYNDAAGVSHLVGSMARYASTVAGIHDPNVSIGVRIGDDLLTTGQFAWPGMDWTIGIIAGRILWMLVAVGMVGLTVRCFDRFGTIELKSQKQGHPESITTDNEEPAQVHSITQLPPLAQPLHFSLWALLRAELILVWRTIGRWWFVAAVAMTVAMLFIPLSVSRLWLWPVAWIWPLAIWSSLGVRERQFVTNQMLYSTPGAFQNRLAALWLSGVAITMFCGGGIGVRFLLAGDSTSLLQWVMGALFIPTLALACGVWTSGTRLFEGVYIALWYIGPMNRAEPFDFMGVRLESWSDGITGVYAAISVGLALLVLVGGKRQMRLDR